MAFQPFGKGANEPMTKAELEARDAEIKKLEEDIPNKKFLRKAGASARKDMLKHKKKVRNKVEKAVQQKMGSFKKGGKVKKNRGDGICRQGKTKGRMV